MVANFVVLSDVAGVIPLTVPVNVAPDKLAFVFNNVVTSVPFNVIAGVGYFSCKSLITFWCICST